MFSKQTSIFIQFHQLSSAEMPSTLTIVRAVAPPIKYAAIASAGSCEFACFRVCTGHAAKRANPARNLLSPGKFLFGVGRGFCRAARFSIAMRLGWIEVAPSLQAVADALLSSEAALSVLNHQDKSQATRIQQKCRCFTALPIIPYLYHGCNETFGSFNSSWSGSIQSERPCS